MTLWLYGTIVVLVVAVVVLQLLADLRFRLARVTPIAQCRHGQYVKVVGRAVAIGELRAPFSERPCVAYRITASHGEKKRRRMANRAHIDKFIVKDDSGEAVVDAAGLAAIGHGHLRLHEDSRWTSTDVANLPALAQLDMPRVDRADEAIVEPGARIAVRARVVIEGETIRLVPRGTQLVVTDEPRLVGR